MPTEAEHRALEAAHAAVAKIRPWSRGGVQAPHKPLLLLLALQRVQAGSPRLVDFNDIEHQLRDLIERFSEGAHRAHPEYPFWRLQRDRLWEIEQAESFPARQSNTDPPISALRKGHARGGLPREVHAALGADPAALLALADEVAARFFPGRVSEVFDAVGLDWVR